MIPKILHHVHFGQWPQGDTQLWMMSARNLHPNWIYYCWNESNIQNIGLDFDTLLFKCKNFASISNIVRLHALNKIGGVYLDTDIEALKPFDPLLDDNGAFYGLQEADRGCNAVIGSKPEHPFITQQLERQDFLENADAARGVYLLNEHLPCGVTIFPQHYFYPWHFNDPKEQRIIHPESYCVHHWQGSWAKK